MTTPGAPDKQSQDASIGTLGAKMDRVEKDVSNLYKKVDEVRKQGQEARDEFRAFRAQLKTLAIVCLLLLVSDSAAILGIAKMLLGGGAL